MDWVARKDMVSLAGLDNTDQNGKEAMCGVARLAKEIVEQLGKKLPKNLGAQLHELEEDMSDCSKCLRQHMEDELRTESPASSHCKYHGLHTYELPVCGHDHTDGSFCAQPFKALVWDHGLYYI